MTELTGMTFEELTSWVMEEGYPAFRGKQVFKWIHQGADFDDMTNLSRSMREELKLKAVAQPVSIRLEKKSPADGTVKLLYEMKDGNCVEGVLMRYKYGISLCISTQVGCRMGCRFCASTLEGRVRDLTAGEMLGEILCANRYLSPENKKVSHVVLMGSGEPLDNYNNVAYTWTIDEIMDACRNYVRKTGRRVIFEYALSDGVNAGEEQAKELADRLRGIQCHVNLIPLNAVEERDMKGVTEQQVRCFLKVLHDKNISATRRREMGDDIEGACGQLRRKTINCSRGENITDAQV